MEHCKTCGCSISKEEAACNSGNCAPCQMEVYNEFSGEDNKQKVKSVKVWRLG